MLSDYLCLDVIKVGNTSVVQQDEDGSYTENATTCVSVNALNPELCSFVCSGLYQECNW